MNYMIIPCSTYSESVINVTALEIFIKARDEDEKCGPGNIVSLSYKVQTEI